MIIKSKKILYIDIVKTAGTSIRHVFMSYGGNGKHHHIKNSSCEPNEGNPTITINDVPGYFKFTIVRNPYDKLVSLYEYRRTLRKSINCSFEEYVKNLEKYEGTIGKNLNIKTMYDWIHDDDGNLCVDYIGKYEDLENVWKFICDKMNITDKLPWKYKTKLKHYTEYYNDELRQIVYKLYEKDFKFFNYDAF